MEGEGHPRSQGLQDLWKLSSRQHMREGWKAAPCLSSHNEGLASGRCLFLKHHLLQFTLHRSVYGSLVASPVPVLEFLIKCPSCPGLQSYCCLGLSPLAGR